MKRVSFDCYLKITKCSFETFKRGSNPEIFVNDEGKRLRVGHHSNQQLPFTSRRHFVHLFKGFPVMSTIQIRTAKAFLRVIFPRFVPEVVRFTDFVMLNQLPALAQPRNVGLLQSIFQTNQRLCSERYHVTNQVCSAEICLISCYLSHFSRRRNHFINTITTLI